MELSKGFVKAKNPCADGFRWFLRHHPQGNDYQPVLDALVADGRVEDACWLLAQFGPTHAVLRLDSLSCEAIVFAGAIEVRGDIEAGTLVRAGRGIRAGGAIRAGRDVVAGEAIVAGGAIEAVSLHAGGDLQAASVLADGAVRVGGQLRCARELVCRRDLDVGAQASVGGVLVVDGEVRVGRSLRVRDTLRTGASVRPSSPGRWWPCRCCRCRWPSSSPTARTCPCRRHCSRRACGRPSPRMPPSA